MKFLFGFLVIIIFVHYSSFVRAQDSLRYNIFGGGCTTIERIDTETGQQQVFNMVSINASAEFHEPNESWEIVLNYECDKGTCIMVVYVRNDGGNQFIGIEEGRINCLGTSLLQNPSDGSLTGTIVIVKETYSVTFTEVEFYPDFTSGN